MTIETQIKFKGVELTVEYDYLPPEYETGFSGETNIVNIDIAGMDAYELLEDQLDEIYKLL